MSVGSSTTSLQRATMWMALGTGVSRLTGVLRVLVLAIALGATHLADAYNLANTTPNMLYDVVLGGVLSATFIPVFVDRLATRRESEAWRAISAVISVSLVVLVLMTVVFWLLAPQVIDAYTALTNPSRAVAQHALAQEKAVATTLLRWFVPQVALYGVIALATALLNTRRRFVAPMWVPIANNVVCIVVLLWFHHLVPNFPSLAGVSAHSGQLVLLGLGTTAGVALQALLLVPSLRNARLGRLRWRWNPRHEAIATVVRLSGWTFGFVLANQIALYIVLALAVGSSGPDPVSAYTYAYSFMQMPYAVIAVSVMSAVTPDLAERWATDDLDAFRQRLSGGLRAVLAIIIPAAVGMFLLAKPVVALLLGHGATTVHATNDTGAALAMFSLGLPGFCTFLYVVRVLQAMQRTRTAFWLYLVENSINVVLAVAFVGPLGVRGLALSLSLAYSVAAVVGIVVLRRWLGALGGPRTWSPLRRIGIATVAMGVVVLVVSNLSGSLTEPALFFRVAGGVVVGGAVFAGTAALLGSRERAGGRGGRAGLGPDRAAPRANPSGPTPADHSASKTAGPFGGTVPGRSGQPTPRDDDTTHPPALRQPGLRLVARSTVDPAEATGSLATGLVPGFPLLRSVPQQPRHVRIRPRGDGDGAEPSSPPRPE